MDLASWLALISPVVAIFIAFFGFRRSVRADRLAAFFQLQERYLAPEARTGRRLIHEHISGRHESEINRLTDDVRASVGFALAVMNSIAIACEAGYVNRAVVIRSMGRSYAAAMAAAKPYVDHLEHKRGFRPYEYAEGLAAISGGTLSDAEVPSAVDG